jgi:YD repeat-containing protein
VSGTVFHPTTAQTGANNELLEDGTYNYTYDKEGSRIEKYVGVNNNDTLDAGDTGVMLLEWEPRNRLVKVTQQTNYGTDTRRLTYEYDAFDRRVVRHCVSVSKEHRAAEIDATVGFLLKGGCPSLQRKTRIFVT